MNHLLLIIVITIVAIDMIDAACTDTMPTTGTTAVQLSFYSNSAAGTTGSNCPSPCTIPVMTKWYRCII